MSSVWDDPEVIEDEATPLPMQPMRESSVSIAPEKIENLTVQVIERVVREIVPIIAEKLIRERLEQLLQEESAS